MYKGDINILTLVTSTDNEEQELYYYHERSAINTSSKELAKMKSSAFIINIARGAIIDEVALINALQSNEIAGAGLDVFSTEPLDKKSPLFELENVFLSPHISGNFPEYQHDVVLQFADNLNRFLAEKDLKNRVCKKRLY